MFKMLVSEMATQKKWIKPNIYRVLEIIKLSSIVPLRRILKSKILDVFSVMNTFTFLTSLRSKYG